RKGWRETLRHCKLIPVAAAQRRRNSGSSASMKFKIAILCVLVVCCSSVLADAPDRPGTLKRMELVMGALPADISKKPVDFKVLNEEKADGYLRLKIVYATAEGGPVPAYLLMPNGFAGKRPAALCLHQTTGIGKGEPAGLNKDVNKHYAHELA